MTPRRFLCITPVLLALFTGCDRASTSTGDDGQVIENIDQADLEDAKNLKPAIDPVAVEIEDFQKGTREMLAARQFDELETLAAGLRASKERFRDGAWKIRQFYLSFEPSDDEPDKIWKATQEIHGDWIKAKPQSITAHVAQANFLVNYAWYVRGSGYASSVSERAQHSFQSRLEMAVETLAASRELPEQDPMWWSVALTAALGQGWPAEDFDEITAEAVAFEPMFERYENQRTYSLLPRWYGEPGDWEKFALAAANRKDGLGAAGYALNIINLRPLHDHIFRESHASWPKTKEGLGELRTKYPDALRYINEAALLATMAEDREYAKEMFDLLGDNYLPDVFSSPKRFAHYRNWARTGVW